MSVERRNFVLREIYRMLKKVTDLEVTPLTKEQERKIVNLLSEVVVEQGFMTAEEFYPSRYGMGSLFSYLSRGPLKDWIKGYSVTHVEEKAGQEAHYVICDSDGPRIRLYAEKDCIIITEVFTGIQITVDTWAALDRVLMNMRHCKRYKKSELPQLGNRMMAVFTGVYDTIAQARNWDQCSDADAAAFDKLGRRHQIFMLEGLLNDAGLLI